MCEWKTEPMIYDADASIAPIPLADFRELMIKESCKAIVDPVIPEYLQPGIENDRYLACMNLVRPDYPCICGRCAIEREEGMDWITDLLNFNRRIQ